MTILVTGGTGLTGSQLIDLLVPTGAEIRALTRSPDNAQFPIGVTPVKGAPSDIDSLSAALEGVSTLFLLVPNVPDEFNQTMTALNIARDAGVRGIVHVSVYKCAAYTDVPHAVCKHAIERMIRTLDLPVSTLRPAFFMQNDLRQKEQLLAAAVYDMPIGHKGVAMVDTRDIAEIAAKEVLRRENSDEAMPSVTYDIVGPENLTGPAVAALWAQALGRDIRYGGDDLEKFERHLREVVPASFAYDLRLMLRHYQANGTPAAEGEVDRVAGLLGHRPRSYREFATETARLWNPV